MGNINEIRELAMHDHTVCSCLNLKQSGDLNYVGMLEMIVLELAKEKQFLTNELVELKQRDPPRVQSLTPLARANDDMLCRCNRPEPKGFLLPFTTCKNCGGDIKNF